MNELFEIPLWAWVFLILGVIKWFEICIQLIKAGITKVCAERSGGELI